MTAMITEEPWAAVKQAAKENRHELVLSGQSISKLIASSGLDRRLFDLQGLNYLNIHQTCLTDVPDEIEKLENLTTLVLHSNEITRIPNTIKNLTKLKVLDCSRNKLANLPEEIGQLPQLTTLNLGSNQLKTIPSQAANTKLSILDLSNNQLDTFPDICHSTLTHLSEVHVNGNKITEIPVIINTLQSLKIFNIADNLLTAVPGELVDCTKLKELYLKNNNFKDKRLMKLVDQCRTKQILDYVQLHCPKTTSATNKGSSNKKGRKGHKGGENEEDRNSVNALTHKLKVLKTTDDVFQIKTTEDVLNVRAYIVACIIRNIKFTDESFKQFIQLQTKLHDGVCEKRNAATIATHDLKSIPPGDLTYTAKLPEELEIKPLMRNKVFTGASLFQQLQTEADNLRKEKKRNVYSGIHKYLYLLEGKKFFPCLVDSTGQVISFPPITNSDITKMSVNTDAMLVEVTSTISYQFCRNVLDQFLKELITSGLCCSKTDDNPDHNNLIVQQVKIVTMDGSMKIIYPSRADLNISDSNVTIIRE